MIKKVLVVFAHILFLCVSSSFLFPSNTSLADSYRAVNDTIKGPKDTDAAAGIPVVKYLALGDSYTIGQSVAVSDRFPIQAVSILRNSGYNVADADIIATTGWTTGNLLNAVKDKHSASPYDFVTLLIGVNNQFRGTSISSYKMEFSALLKKSIELTGNRPQRVVVVSIPDYSVTPFAIGPINRGKIAREIDSFNKVNRQLAESFHVQYLNVTHESRRAASFPFLVASDGLHFSGLEYKIWAEMLVGLMKRSIGVDLNPRDSLYKPVYLSDDQLLLH